jgi:predicted SprT family Zn-dependent metalloprotease
MEQYEVNGHAEQAEPKAEVCIVQNREQPLSANGEVSPWQWSSEDFHIEPNPDPTEQAYAELKAAYRFYNRALFNDELPFCLITFQRKPRTGGYFSSKRFENQTGTETDEIALNPRFFKAWGSVEGILSVLVHEMVHLWQFHYGKPGRGRYHNVEWGNKMESLGLLPTSTGKPGGERVGQRVSHYIIPGGLFERATTALIDYGLTVSWRDKFHAKEPGKGPTNTRAKFFCAECGLQAWAKPSARLRCEDCDQPMHTTE